MTGDGDRPVRVVHVINQLGGGGAERSLADLLAEPSADIDHTVVALKRDHAEKNSWPHATTWLPPVGTSGRAAMWAAMKEIRRLRPDVIHTSLFDADILGRVAGIGTGAAMLTSVVSQPYSPAAQERLTAGPTKRAIVRYLDVASARGVRTHFHAVSQSAAADAVRVFSIPPDRIDVVPRARSRSVLGERTAERTARVRASLDIAPERRVVLVLGREALEKRHADVIAALDALDDTGDVTLVIAGPPGSASDAIDAALATTGPLDVRRLGYRSDVGDILCAADLLVSASALEGMSGVLLEALALEVPIVASDIASHVETLDGGRLAALFAVGDVPALTALLAHEFADGHEVALARAAAGRRHFDEHHELGQVRQRMQELWRQLARGRQDR